jgi:pentatricopeptide repeat protein
MLKELGASGLVPNVITYTTVMRCCFRSRRFEQGLEIFEEMIDKGYTFDGFAYCTVVGALVKTCRIEEASHYMERMVNTDIGLDMASYNTLINLYCKGGKLEMAHGVLDKMEKEGFERDEYTNTILMNGLCEEGDVEGAMEYMNVAGFNSNLVALNTMVDRWCKADQIDYAFKIFDSMDMRDSFTYSSLIHNLCKVGRFRCASKLLLSCVRSGTRILPSAKRAVFDCLRHSGHQREAKRLKSEIKLALSAVV